MTKERALITFGWCRNAYAVMRNLAQHGVSVYVGGPTQRTMCSVSKFCSGTFTYPSPYTDPQGFVDAVIRAAERLDTDVFIPVHEETFVVAQHIDHFPSWLKIPITTAKNLYLCHDKGDCMRLAEELGVSIPQTIHPKRVDEIYRIAPDLEYPQIIKLRYSNSAKGVFKVNTPNELIARYKQVALNAHYMPIVQKFIGGAIYTADLLYKDGERIAHFCRRNIREKARAGGAASKIESVIEPILVEQSDRILSHLGWNGVALCEFKYDPHTGMSHLFEINPRYWGTTPFDVDCGVEFPWYHYQLAKGRVPMVASQYCNGKVSQWLLGDFIGIIERLGDKDALISHLKGMAKFYDVDYFMDFKIDDPLPFLEQTRYYLSKFVRSGSANPIDEGMIG